MIAWNYSLWTPWAQPSVPLYLTLTLNASFEPLRRGIGTTLFTSIIHFEDGIGTWVFRNDEAAALGYRMLDYLRVPQHKSEFEDELLTSVASLEKEIDASTGRSGDQNVRNVDELLTQFQDLETAYYRFYVLGAFVEPVQIAAQQRLTPALVSAAQAVRAVSDSEVMDMASTAYASDEETFATGITRNLANLAEELVKASHTNAELNDALRPWRSTDEADGREAAAGGSEAVVKLLAISSPELGQKIAEHAIRYRWSLNNYARCREMSPSDVVREIMLIGSTPEDAARLLNEELEAVSRNMGAARDIKRALAAHLSAFDAQTLSLHDLIGVRLLDLRKRLIMQTNGAFTQILSQLAERLKVPITNFLYLLPEEIPAYAQAPERYEDRIVLRKEAVLVYRADLSVLDEQAHRWSDGFSSMEGAYLGEGEVMALRLLERLDQRLNLLQHEKSTGTEIPGTTIFYDKNNPVISGKAVVIRDPVAETLNIGDVLVASSTTPDFISAIRNSSAIVTDWGGQTSHAAITARELGKPCIIGTNFASMVLRTGDQVDLDFLKAIVRRVS